MSSWNRKQEYIDLTHDLNENTTVFPGDPRLVREIIGSVIPGNKGSHTLLQLHLGNHMGTHIDFPCHVIEGGKSSSDYSINDLIGQGCVIEVPDEIFTISGNFVSEYRISRGDFVFFKTKNSKISEFDSIPKEFVHLDSSAAEMLVEKGARVVGIDYLSVDAPEAKDLPVHHYLLSHDVLIVEGLNLANVGEGRGEIIIAPLKIAAIDGVPARVLMRKE